MDEKDKQILKMIRGNARMSYQEIGDKLEISRVAAIPTLSAMTRSRC